MRKREGERGDATVLEGRKRKREGGRGREREREKIVGWVSEREERDKHTSTCNASCMYITMPHLRVFVRGWAT